MKSQPDKSDTRAVVVTAALAHNALALIGWSDVAPHAAGQVRLRLENELAGPPSFHAMTDDDLHALREQLEGELARRGWCMRCNPPHPQP